MEEHGKVAKRELILKEQGRTHWILILLKKKQQCKTDTPNMYRNLIYDRDILTNHWVKE